MTTAQGGGQTPRSLPPVCPLLETLEMRPDIVLTNARQGPGLPWALGNDLEDLKQVFLIFNFHGSKYAGCL